MAAVTRKLLVIEIKFQIRRHFGILRNVHAGFQGLTVFYHAIMEESFLNYTNNYFKRSSYYLWMKFYSSRKRHLILTFAGYHGPFQYEVPIPVRSSETLFSTFFCSS